MEAPIDAPMETSLKALLMASLKNQNMLYKCVEHLDIKHSMKGFVFTGSSWTKSDQRIKDDNLQADKLRAEKLQVDAFVRDETFRLANYRCDCHIPVSWGDFWTMKKFLVSTSNPLTSSDAYAEARCRFRTYNGHD
jgi:hypothetical protein